MVYKLYSFKVIIRVMLILVSSTILSYLISNTGYYVSILLFSAILIVQVFELLNLLNMTNKELTMFLNAIANSDFSQSYSKSKYLGKSIQQLDTAFESVLSKFKQTRTEKEEVVQYLQVLLQHVPVMVLDILEDGKIITANKEAKTLFGQRRILYLDDLAEIDKELSDGLKKILPGEKRLVETGLSGANKVLTLSATEIGLRHVKHKIVAIQNIRRELESQEIEAWQDVIHVLSHEIMNSITPIVSLGESAQQILESSVEEDDKESMKDIQTILSTISHRGSGLLEFVENYRELSKFPTPDPEYFKVGALFSNVVHLLENELKQKDIELDIELPDQELDLFADMKLLEQALINLIKNSIEALVGIEEPYIQLKAFRDNCNQITLTISDNGAGIAEQDIGKIWIPFYSTKERGSGIGLSFVRQIALSHGGMVNVSSRPDQQTAFSMTFS